MKPSAKKKTPEEFRGVWGLTGGVASGKSTVAKIFQELGCQVLDADQLAREIRGDGGAAQGPILKRFGTLDPAKLREIVFQDPQAKKDLESILHPLIREESLRRIQKMQPPILYEAALLFETGRYSEMEGLIVVEAPQEVRIQRLMERDRISPELAQKILSAQASDEQRRSVATWVIQNTGSIDDLKSQVQKILSQLRSKSN